MYDLRPEYTIPSSLEFSHLLLDNGCIFTSPFSSPFQRPPPFHRQHILRISCCLIFIKLVMSGLKDKVVLVTGASSGIGKGTAIHMAGLGCKLSLVARYLCVSIVKREKYVRQSVAVFLRVSKDKAFVSFCYNFTNISDELVIFFPRINVF